MPNAWFNRNKKSAPNLLRNADVCMFIKLPISVKPSFCNFSFTESGNYKINQYHQNYGYDLEATLSKYPIKELNNQEYKSNLIRSLERGNLQSATFTIDGKEQKIFIAANPATKSLRAFDEKNQKILLSDLLDKNKHNKPISRKTNRVFLKNLSKKKRIK